MEVSDKTVLKQKEHKFPVVEIFGPTIQGEGVDQGQPCHFVRFGGCDYKCEWCDTPHAVLPNLVRQAPRMTTEQIVNSIRLLTSGPRLIVLSGGNPCLHELELLVLKLQTEGYSIALETQGTVWKSWIRRCDRIAVSPKPPSSGHITNLKELAKFMMRVHSTYSAFLKVVVFDSTDYDFAKVIHQRFPNFKMFLSAGNDAGKTVGNPDRVDNRTDSEVSQDLITKARWLVNRTMVDPLMHDVSVQMQNHVLYWGNSIGR